MEKKFKKIVKELGVLELFYFEMAIRNEIDERTAKLEKMKNKELERIKQERKF